LPVRALRPEEALGVECDSQVEELYRRSAPSFVRLLAARTRRREDAADLVQSIFARLVARARATSLDSPDAYLGRMAANEGVSHMRRMRRELELIEAFAEAGEPSVDPHRQLETRDMLRRVEAAVARLKPRTRAIFLAHRIEGLSYAEIAGRMGMSVKGVEKQMSKAMAHIDRTVGRG
jgi:RNA polymerase sigma factor (sigma-70 family)